MLPLLVKDGLLVPSVAATLLCYEVIRVTLRPLHNTATLLKLLVSGCQWNLLRFNFRTLSTLVINTDPRIE